MRDFIGYDGLRQAALRGMIREVLRRVEENGAPPGDHHFYISFASKAPGVSIAPQLVERFPEEMTIVIQHQFWDLEVDAEGFGVVLKFSGVPQHLYIPWDALTRFVDPSVNFGIAFEGKPGPAEGEESGSKRLGDQAPSALAAITPHGAAEPPEAAPGEDAAPPEAAQAGGSGGGTVVSIDAFRRK